MQTDPLTPRDLYDNVDFYRNMRMNLDSDGGGNVWRYLFCFGEKAASSSVSRMNRPACCCSSM